MSKLWFAWRPVRLGPYKDGPWAWLRKVWRVRRGDGSTFYQMYWGA